MIDELLKRYPIISDQVNEKELRVILRELLAVLEVPGDVVEFGCYKGTTSLFLGRVLKKFNTCHPELVSGSNKECVAEGDKKLFLYDSFAGLPGKTAPDRTRVGDDFRAGELLATKKELINNFKKAGLRVPIVKKAWFSDLSDQDIPSQIAFAFFDGDFYQSIRDSFRLCDRHFSCEATIIVDDYQNESLPGATAATDEWLKRNSARIKNFRVEQSLGIIHLAER